MSETGITQAQVTRFVEGHIKTPADFGKTLSLGEFGFPEESVTFEDFRKDSARALCIRIQGWVRPTTNKKLQAEIDRLKAELARRGEQE